MHRIGSILILILLSLNVFSQESPTLQCLQLRNENTRLYVAWSNSADCAEFDKYYFYVNNVLKDSLLPSTGYTLCNYGSKVINNIPNASSYSCRIDAIDHNGTAHPSNSIQTINITVTPSTDSSLAYLSWESPSSSALSGNWGTTFSIYRKHDFENDFDNTPIATVPNTQFTYTDTADVCYGDNSYQVGIVNNYSQFDNCIFKTTIGTVTLVDRFAPQTPILDSISYTEDNRVGLGFHAPEEHMRGYIVYYLNNGWEPIDTIYNATYWIDPNGGDRCYRIAVLDSCYNSSPMTTEEQCDMKIFIQSTDACQRSVNLNWSTYTNMHNDVMQYEVFYSSDNGMTWQSGGTTTNHSLTIQNLQTETAYLAFVRATNNGQTITASSNRTPFIISNNGSSDFTYIRTVSVTDNHHIDITVHTSGDTLPFQRITLQRSEDGINFTDLQNQGYHADSEYSFADSSADFNHKLYYYRTYVINNCDMAAGHSNISHNILLTGEATTAQENNLQWNNYNGWDGGISEYYVFRKLETDLGYGIISGSLTPMGMNVYYDDVSQLYETGSRFEYYIEAKEFTNDYGFNEISYSNRISLMQSPNTYIPNAFAPLGTVNRVFMPINTFVSTENYSFTIYSRWGDKVFSTHNPYIGWDGFYNGHVAPTGVYVYRISYLLPDGKPFVKTGSVTLVND